MRLEAHGVDALVVVEARAIGRVRNGLAPSPALPVEVGGREMFLVAVGTVERLKVAVILARDVDRVGVQLGAVGSEDGEETSGVPGLIAGLEETLVLATRLEKLATGAAVVRRAEHILGEVHLLLAIHDGFCIHGEIAIVQFLNHVVSLKLWPITYNSRQKVESIVFFSRVRPLDQAGFF